MSSPLIDSTEVGDAQLVDCRFRLGEHGAGRVLFREGHIPGARYLDLDQFNAGGGKAPMLPGLGGSKPKPAPALPVTPPLPGT